jgi:hypothetical protein
LYVGLGLLALSLLHSQQHLSPFQEVQMVAAAFVFRRALYQRQCSWTAYLAKHLGRVAILHARTVVGRSCIILPAPISSH